MRKYKIFLASLLALLFILPSCSDKKYDHPNMSNGNEIRDVKVTYTSNDNEVITLSAKLTDDTEYSITVPRDFDLTQLEHSKISFSTSMGAVASPDTALTQDLSKDVVYTLTAESGKIREWTIKYQLANFLDAGIGSIVPLWYKDIKEMGFTTNTENTVAVIDDNLVLSRTGLMYDYLTGDKVQNTDGSHKKLSFNGITGAGDPTQNIPFCLTTDDVGTLLGGTLSANGAWFNDHFKVYTWKNASSDPELVMDFQEEGAPLGVNGANLKTSLGRKFFAYGDILKGDGVLTSPNSGTTNITNYHYIWKSTNGVIDVNNPFKVTSGYKSSSSMQAVSPLNFDNPYPLVFGDGGGTQGDNPKMNVGYAVKQGSNIANYFFKGPNELGGPSSEGWYTGWGNRLCEAKIFTFNGERYIAVLHSSLKNVYVSIYKDIEDPDTVKLLFTNKVTPILHDGKVTTGEQNGNMSGGFGFKYVETQGGGKELYLIVLYSSSFIEAFLIDNIEPI